MQESREKRRERIRALGEGPLLGVSVECGCRRFFAERGQLGEDGKITRRMQPAPEEAKPAPRTVWVSRGAMPAVAPRYAPDMPSRVLTDARDIVALARIKGLVTGGDVPRP